VSSQAEPPQDHPAVPDAGHQPPAELDHRTIDLIALVCILAACTAICLWAGTGALQAVIGAAGILFATWRTPPRTRRQPRSVPARRRPPRRPGT
jgi:hypothetical protein